ncbi:M20 aminoacylase family protein [Nitratireductor basaltis]|uniref:Amidohydrolase n=1 Tax=Nitratireductor basaltis TaxID=472175 RepID=A0A084U7J9_9HYPH|nr:M20 aminoacylase family protein [Nitratireductor basaltis]KFB08935.1 Amidohydrolase [Nitratireductor basaltis]
MPILNRAAELQGEVTAWRHHLHQRPEILYEVHETAAFVADKLRQFGCDEVVTGIGRTGVVGIINGSKGAGRVIGLRADMDALPMREESGKPYSSLTEGRMHACGHDGHMSMLLGAAKYLSETRNFAGRVALIFQPAEEGGAGGAAMVQDGMMERFGIEKVYGMHNLPGLPVGQFAIRPGPIMAATAEFEIVVRGRGGHAAMPHKSIDPVVAAGHLVVALQGIASRSADPLESLVVSVTQIHGGDAHNIIPDQVVLRGTVRTLRKEMAGLAEQRMREISAGIAAAHRAQISVDYDNNYPVTFNVPDEARFAQAIAGDIAGAERVDGDVAPLMGGEDFSYMLEARPGAFIFIGNGDSAYLHNSRYDFCDEAIPFGISYWARLVETALAPA